MTFKQIAATDPVVASGLACGLSMEEIIVQLWIQKQAILERCIKLDAIAPKKYRLSNDEVIIWRCPDEFVPFTPITMKGG